MLNKFYKLVVVSAAFIPISIYATENQIDSVSQQRNIPQLTEIVGSSIAKKLCDYQTDEGWKTTDRLKKMLIFLNNGGEKVLQSVNLELPTPQWDKIQKCWEEFHINDTYMVRNATGNFSVFLTHVFYEMLTTVKKEDTAGFLSLKNWFPYCSPALVTHYLTPKMTYSELVTTGLNKVLPVEVTSAYSKHYMGREAQREIRQAILDIIEKKYTLVNLEEKNSKLAYKISKNYPRALDYIVLIEAGKDPIEAVISKIINATQWRSPEKTQEEYKVGGYLYEKLKNNYLNFIFKYIEEDKIQYFPLDFFLGV